MNSTRNACSKNQVVPVSFVEDSDLSFISGNDDQPICRICLETELNSNKLISPCKCKGTLKYVHEECLKTWLISLDIDVDEGSCELCKTSYIMEFNLKYRCSFSSAQTDGVTNSFFMALLLTVLVMLGFIVYLLFDRYFERSKEKEEGIYSIALIVICVISWLVLLALIVNALKTFYCTRTLSSWVILNQDFGHNEENESLNDISMLDKQEVPLVMVVPDNIVVRGHKVKTPVLAPSLHRIERRGQAVAFTPAFGLSLVSRGPSVLSHYTEPLRRESHVQEDN